ncbi:DNA-invertase hin [subsurface metagenome]
MKIGYARVSTQDQNLELQLSELDKYGCKKIYKEKVSAVKDRPELDKMLEQLREGDSVVVWKLDRLGRSLKHLVDLLTLFNERGVDFISINDSIDTTTAQGRLIFNLFASFAEFERELISERTKAGMKAARAKGHFAGRKPGLSKDAKKTARAALMLSRDKGFSVGDILKELSISKTTYYRYIAWGKTEENKRSSSD